MTTGAAAGHQRLHRFAKRWRWECVLCGRVTVCLLCNSGANPRLAATRDHWVPKSRGGKTALNNLVLACQECNERKGNSLPDGPPPIAPKPAVPLNPPPPSRPKRPPLSAPIWQACADGWYKTQRQADLAAAAIFTVTGRQFKAYQCQYCPQWHLARVAETSELEAAC